MKAGRTAKYSVVTQGSDDEPTVSGGEYRHPTFLEMLNAEESGGGFSVVRRHVPLEK